jgi:DNA polymerase-3 subunit delta
VKLAGAAARRFLAAPDRAAHAALFYGPNRSAVAQACDDVVRALLGPTPDDFALTRLDEDAIRRDRALLGDELAAQSLLGGERLVRVRAEGDSAADSLIGALGDLEGGAAGAFLLVEGGDLAARSKIRAAFEAAARAVVMPFYDDEPEALAAIAHAALAERKVHLTPAARALLDASLPADRALLRGEIEKLALFAHGRGEAVDVQDVAALLAVEQEAALDDATLAAAAGRAGDAVEALAAADAAGISAIRALERRLLRLMEARTLVESGSQPAEAVQKLRPPVFWKERDAFITHVRAWSLGAIAAGLDILWRAQLRAMTAGAPQDLIAADAFRAVAGLASRRAA